MILPRSSCALLLALAGLSAASPLPDRGSEAAVLAILAQPDAAGAGGLGNLGERDSRFQHMVRSNAYLSAVPVAGDPDWPGRAAAVSHAHALVSGLCRNVKLRDLSPGHARRALSGDGGDAYVHVWGTLITDGPRGEAWKADWSVILVGEAAFDPARGSMVRPEWETAKGWKAFVRVGNLGSEGDRTRAFAARPDTGQAVRAPETPVDGPPSPLGPSQLEYLLQAARAAESEAVVWDAMADNPRYALSRGIMPETAAMNAENRRLFGLIMRRFRELKDTGAGRGVVQHNGAYDADAIGVARRKFMAEEAVPRGVQFYESRADGISVRMPEGTAYFFFVWGDVAVPAYSGGTRRARWAAILADMPGLPSRGGARRTPVSFRATNEWVCVVQAWDGLSLIPSR